MKKSVKERIIEEYKKGTVPGIIAQTLGCNKQFVSKVIFNYRSVYLERYPPETETLFPKALEGEIYRDATKPFPDILDVLKEFPE